VTPEWHDRIAALPARLFRLAEYLRTSGYRFANPKGLVPGPAPDVERCLRRLEELVGVVPAALAHFYRTVGSVDLRGEHPAWNGCDLSDPLVVEPITAVVEEAEQYVELKNPAEEYWASESGVFRAPIAPDDYHKADVSGGMWLGVEIPNADVDPVVLEESHALPFTLYLELVLEWGGFLGLETAEDHSWPLDELRSAASRTGG